MKTVKEINKFFKENPVGQQVVKLCNEIKELFNSARTKARGALKEYVKRLLESEKND